jgi:8-amino-7-oxononanoate synthase
MQRHILAVDDDRDVLDELSRDLIEAFGSRYRVQPCESAADANQLIAEIESAGDELALIVCDQVMPGEDGVHFLESLTARHPETKKVLLTGYAGLESAVYGLNRSGLHRYLEKPWQAADLQHTAGELLADYEADRPIPPAGAADLYSLADYFRRDGADLYAKVEAFAEYVDDVRQQGFYMHQRPLTTACANVVEVGHRQGEAPRRMIMMASNNYLGLTTHPQVIAAAREGAARYGAGSGAVPLLSGTLEIHRMLEDRLAAFKQGDACCLFPTGFSANVGIIAALARQTDAVFLDHLVHASIVEGARASGARVRTFHHNDVDDLDRKLQAESRRSTCAGKLVVVDAVYSMDGDIAPLPDILTVAHRHGAKVMVDEAHSTGVIGERGRGITEHFGLRAGDVDVLMGTLSKALGSIGGFCVAPRKVVDYIRHYARPFIFSTSLPPATVCALLAALDVVEAEPERVRRLRANAERMRSRLRAAGFETGASETPIIPVIVGDRAKLLRMGKAIHERGVYLNSVFFPAVPLELSRLRITVMATHTEEDVNTAADVVIDVGQSHGLPATRASVAAHGSVAGP